MLSKARNLKVSACVRVYSKIKRKIINNNKIFTCSENFKFQSKKLQAYLFFKYLVAEKRIEKRRCCHPFRRDNNKNIICKSVSRRDFAYRVNLYIRTKCATGPTGIIIYMCTHIYSNAYMYIYMYVHTDKY